MSPQKRTSTGKFALRSWWIALVVIAVVVASAVYVGGLRLSEIPDRAIGHSPPAPEVGLPRGKTIEYSVSGPTGATARVSYLVPGQHVIDERVTLPWQKSVRALDFTTSAGVLIQADRSTAVRCMVKVNGVERATSRSTAENTPVSCSVPVA